MDCHNLLDTFINNGIHHLSEDLQDPYQSGVCVFFGYEDQDCLLHICRDIPALPHEFDQIHKFHPFFWFVGGGCLLSWVQLPQPHLEVLRLQVYVDPALFTFKRCTSAFASDFVGTLS